MPKTGLDEFKVILKDFRELGSFAVKGTVALPLINLWAKFGPPPTGAISLLTSAAEFLAVMWTFHFWHNTPAKRLNERMKLAAVAFCAALAASGVLIQQFTLHPAKDRDRIVMGSRLRADVQPLMSATYTALDALRDAEYNPERVWTAGSITIVYTSLIACWLVAFISVSIFVSIFILLQRRSQAAAHPVSRGRIAKRPPAI